MSEAQPAAIAEAPTVHSCRRKQQQVENQLKELGMDSLQERLEDAAQTPANPPYRLATLIQVTKAIPHRGSIMPLKFSAAP